jgi:hypothetical protein
VPIVRPILNAMDRSVALKSLLVQLAAVAVVSIVLALALPHSFFEDWGWISGPVAWVACAAITARVLSLPIVGALIGSILVGLPAVVAVIVGVHWLGALIAAVLFGLWCGRLAVDPDLDAELV